MLRCDSIVVFHQLRCEFAAGWAPMRRKIKRDHYLFFERFVIKTNQATVVPGNVNTFHERTNEIAGRRRRTRGGTLSSKLALIQSIELAGFRRLSRPLVPFPCK